MRPAALLLPAALAVALPASRGRADDPITVKLFVNREATETVAGTVAVKSFTIKGVHGTMEVPAARVTDIGTASRFTQEGQHVLRVSTTDEQTFEGVIVSPKTLDVEGKYGRFSTTWEDVCELKVVGRSVAPADDDDEEEEGDGPGAWAVRIETDGGDRLSGPLYSITEGPIDAVEIDCDFGSLCFDAKKIRSIEFGPEPGTAPEDGQSRQSAKMEYPLLAAPEPEAPFVGVDTRKWGTIVATDGRKLSGTITVPSGWSVETDLGYLSLKAGKLKSITFEGPADSPDILAGRPARPSSSPPNLPGDKMPSRPEQAASVRDLPGDPVGGVAPERR